MSLIALVFIGRRTRGHRACLNVRLRMRKSSPATFMHTPAIREQRVLSEIVKTQGMFYDY